MKKLKIFAIAIAVCFVSLGIYANFRTLSLGETVKPVHLTAFSIKNNSTPESLNNLKESVASSTGVTACSISKEGDLVAVTYHPDETSQASLMTLISNSGTREVSVKEFPVVSGGCPVHKVGASFSSLLSVLDLRH